MESKILIDINYASRLPQIVIHYFSKSDDPRDKLISMLIGEAMPGVRDGYCRIEKYPDNKAEIETFVITPIHPVELVQHIPTIAHLATTNTAIDTAGVLDTYKGIIKAEFDRLNKLSHPIQDADDLPIAGQIQREILKGADDWIRKNMPADIYNKWHTEMFGFPPEQN